MTIYVVTSGSYSDYGIAAIFTARADADAYVAWRNGPGPDLPYDEYRVEEYETDVPFEVRGAFQWAEDLPARSYDHPAARWEPDENPNAPATVDIMYDGTLWFRGYGETPEHARRSAAELQRRWVTDPALRKLKCDEWRAAEHSVPANYAALEAGVGAPQTTQEKKT